MATTGKPQIWFFYAELHIQMLKNKVWNPMNICQLPNFSNVKCIFVCSTLIYYHTSKWIMYSVHDIFKISQFTKRMTTKILYNQTKTFFANSKVDKQSQNSLSITIITDSLMRVSLNFPKALVEANNTKFNHDVNKRSSTVKNNVTVYIMHTQLHNLQLIHLSLFS